MIERRVFSTNDTKISGDLHTENEVGCLPHNIHKNNSKWFIGLRLWAKTIKLLEENIGANLHVPWVMQSS